MLNEEKIRSRVEKDIEWLEWFVSEEKTNIHRNHIVEADRMIHRLSTLYEVLEEKPEDDVIELIESMKEKLS